MPSGLWLAVNSDLPGRPRRRRLPTVPELSALQAGTVKVGIGLAFFGVSTYAFTAIVLRALGPQLFADFNVYWGLAYGLGLGAMLPFEQEVSRRTAIVVHSHGSVDRTLTAASLVAVGFAGLLALAVLPFVVRGGQDHALTLWLVTVATFVVLGIAYVSRGGLSGQSSFGRYSAQLVAEGGVRLGLVVACAVLAVTSPWTYAAVVPAALLVAVALTLRWEPYVERAVWPLVGQVATSVAPLMVASIISLTLVNFGPVAIRYVQNSPDPALDGSYLAAAFIARLPIFAFAAVQAVLLPRLTRSVVGGDAADFRRALTKVLLPTLGLGLFAVVGVAAIGPWLLRLLAGSQYALPRFDMVLLTAAYGCYLVTLVLQPAAVALAQHRASAVVWLMGALTFGIAWLLPTQASTAVSTAIAVVSVTVSAGLAWVVSRGLSARMSQRTV